MQQALLKLGSTSRMHQDPPRRGAALPSCAGRSEHDCRHRKIQIRSLIDDDRIVAAKLQETLAQTCGSALSDVASDRSGASERHECDAPIIHEPGGKLGSRIDEELEDRRQARL